MLVTNNAYNAEISTMRNIKIMISFHNFVFDTLVREVCLNFLQNLPIAARCASMDIIFLFLGKFDNKMYVTSLGACKKLPFLVIKMYVTSLGACQNQFRLTVQVAIW